MKLTRMFLIVSVLLATPFTVFAEDAAPKKELNPWVDCGIGAMIFTDTSWAAVSSNIIWDLGTTAVSSDQTSQQYCNSSKAKAAMYIGATYANLEEETVKGDGKHLHAMLDIMGCSSDSHANIITAVRSDFSKQLQGADYIEKTSAAKAEQYYNLVNTKVSADYASSCSASSI